MAHSQQQLTIPTTDCTDVVKDNMSKATSAQDKIIEQKHHYNGRTTFIPGHHLCFNKADKRT